MGTDPGIAHAQLSDETVDLPTETTPNDYKLNGPLPLRRAQTTTAEKRHARIQRAIAKSDQVAERRITRRTWDGTPTKHQQRELEDLRTYELARDNDELPDLKKCMGGTTLVALAESGRLGPFHRVPRTLFDELAFDKKERGLIAWLLAAQLVHGAEWVIARHVDFADVLEICETDAARAMRRLCRDRFVRRMPLYDRVTIAGTATTRTLRRHARAACAYQITDRVLVLLGLREPDTMAERSVKARVFARAVDVTTKAPAAAVGGKYQATETPTFSANPDGRAISHGGLEEPAGEDAAGSILTVPAVTADAAGRHAATERTAAPSEAPEGEDAERTPASTQRLLAMFRKTFADQLDRLHVLEQRRLQARERGLSEDYRRRVDELAAEKRRWREAYANLMRETGRPDLSRAAASTDAEYERELAQRRAAGQALPDYETWRREVDIERGRERRVLERIGASPAAIELLLSDDDEGGAP